MSDYVFYSGGAKGADTEWENALKNLGYTVIVYTPDSLMHLSSNELNEIEHQYEQVVKKLGRKKLPFATYAGKLVRRDMLQAKDAETIYAIATLNNEHTLVNGGTGYATTRGIIRGIPVYVYEQNEQQWYVYQEFGEQFIKCDRPQINNHGCMVGSREINEAGKNELKMIINASFF